MQLVDSFIDVILYTRNFERTANNESYEYEVVRTELMRLFSDSHTQAINNGYSEELYSTAKQGIVAYVDEVIQCSSWVFRSKWKKEPLQRIYYDTTNLGDEFYEILNKLNKFGPEREVREVYSLCLGLGFHGKYFNPSERNKYEEVKSFNLGILLNDEAQKNIDSTILFPASYGKGDKRLSGNYRPRVNIIPYVIATPVVIILIVMLYGGTSISRMLSAIAAMVN